MKYGIVIFPTKQLQDLANSYRKRYDPHYSLIPPHITLANSFEAGEIDGKEIAKKCNLAAKKIEPFQIHVTKYSSFQPVNNVIYMKIEPTKEIINLHESIYESLGGQNPEYNFVPHITVGQKLSNDEHSDVYGSLKLQQVDHYELVDRFHLLYQLENGSWTVFETFRLGKES